MNSQWSAILKGLLGFRVKAWAAAIALAFLCQNLPLRAATLADFGYQNWNVNGQLAAGTRPLLVICVNFAEQAPLPQPISYYSNLVFNSSQTPSMNGYFEAVSDGRFAFTPGGVISLSLPASENFLNTYSQYPAPPNPFATADGIYASNIIAHAMLSGAFNFTNYDANHDGHITVDELAIAIIVNDTNWGTGSRISPVVHPAGLNYDWGAGSTPNVSLLNGNNFFIIMCEETEETLGCRDIYGADNLSTGLTPQSGGWWYGPATLYYLDPWNRMHLGWCQPRIFSLTAGGITTLSAAQAGDPTAPIILYDPLRGTTEFFMLEYRTHTDVLYGPGYDETVADGLSDGLVIWHVQQDANYNPTLVISPISTNLTPAVWAENSPNLIPSASPALWGSGSTSPDLKWINGTQTVTTIHVRPFNPGANSITVEWLSAEDTWVDFNFQGSPESGTFSNPFNTVSGGVNAVSYGGILNFKTGSSLERPFINKPMTLKAYNGPVTIGSQ